MRFFLKPLLVTTFSSILVFSGCASGPNGSGITAEQATIIAGAVAGGVAGHQMGGGKGKTAMTVLGVMLGGYLGGVMSNQSRQRTNYALDQAPNNAPTTWTEPKSNNRYTVTPTNTYNSNVNGQKTTCRDYNMDAYIDGRLQQVKGRACKDATGQWVATK